MKIEGSKVSRIAVTPRSEEDGEETEETEEVSE
jgi:hypothetical protein